MTVTDILWMLCRLCVVLSEGHDLCCFNREKCVWNLWDRGTRCFICGLWLVSTIMESISKLHLNLQPTMMNSRLWKWFLTMSSGRLLYVPWDVGKWKVVTWLILPVVICLSQRLSHACLSINKFVLWNCEWLIKSVIVYLMLPCYMDNCGNSRANTCNQAPTSGRGVFIR